MLRQPNGATVNLTVRAAGDECKAVASMGGAGDSFLVRAQFTLDTMKKGELSVHPGEIYHVSDSNPEGHAGFWMAYRLDGSKPAAECMSGLIPNRSKADQLAIKQNLSNKDNDQRSNAFFKSFRRSKSADRSRNLRSVGDLDDSTATEIGMGYERVIRIRTNPRKPAVVLGLFCDKVMDMLVRDSPDLFESLGATAERKDADPPVDVEMLKGVVKKGKHPLLVLVPPSIEYLLHHTDLNPIVIYLAPVSKAIVKHVKNSLAPNYAKNAGFMYEEAVKFERIHSGLFTAIVEYSADDWWFFNLKEAIKNIQAAPAYRMETPAERESYGNKELQKIYPEWGNATGKTSLTEVRRADDRKGQDKTVRISRTTDDIPENNKKSKPVESSVKALPGPGTKSVASPSKQPESTSSPKTPVKQNNDLTSSTGGTVSHNTSGQSSSSSDKTKGSSSKASAVTVASNKKSAATLPPQRPSGALNVHSRETPL